MCGIHAAVALIPHGEDGSSAATAGKPLCCLSDTLRRRLCRRGPDHLGQVVAEHRPSSHAQHSQHGDVVVALQLTSTVLALRGDGLTRQPFVHAATQSVLCWNGEAWTLGADHAAVAGNDGAQLFALLCGVGADTGTNFRETYVLQILRAIEGPFAFVYYDRPAARLYYGRDRLGRRSLLQRHRHGQLELSSVSDMDADADGGGTAAAAAAADPWTEVAADGIYVMDLDADRPLEAARHDWSTTDKQHNQHPDTIISGLGRFNMDAVPPPEDAAGLTANSPSVRQLRDQLAASLRLRVENIPRPPRADDDNLSSEDTRVAVLFSGGLDCAVLARMSHDLVPADQGIDLINVAFENPRVAAHLPPSGVAGATTTSIYEACPDRITGRRSWAELQRVCPGRAWRFLAVDVPYAENVKHRPEIIALMHPHNTEMDLSIASALYFAARATADMPARVLLSGLGADELFGGYGRHSVAFATGGGGGSNSYRKVADELRLDVARLGQRNLGRDDRVFAHWGREVRFPFLDEQLVRWAIALPAWAKCDFGSGGGGDGKGDGVEPAKRVLRLVALSLGMAGVAHEKKRAIQFGARTAKMESGRVKGTAVLALEQQQDKHRLKDAGL